MTEEYQPSGDKEALSPASQPLYLCYSLSRTRNPWNQSNTFFSVTGRTATLMSAIGLSPSAGAPNCALPGVKFLVGARPSACTA